MKHTRDQSISRSVPENIINKHTNEHSVQGWDGLRVLFNYTNYMYMYIIDGNIFRDVSIERKSGTALLLETYFSLMCFL